jgi:putative ABC transport system permease protein
MHWLLALMRRIQTLWKRDSYERELADEMRFHLEMLTEHKVRSGIPPAEARRAALLAFGAAERFKDECRDARGVGVLEEAAADGSHAARAFRRSPGFTLAAVLTLALGIGATVAVFSAVSALLLRPLPYPSAERIVVIGEAEAGKRGDRGTTSYANAMEWKTRSRALEAVAVVDDWSPTLTTSGEPERLAGARVTADIFRVLRVAPALGRPISPADNVPGSEPVIVLEHGFWKRRFQGDPRVVGRTVTLSGKPFRVVGVLPAGFRGPAELAGEVWGSYAPDPRDDRDARSLRAFARIRQDRTPAGAREELARISDRLAEEYPENRGMRAVATTLREELAGSAGGPLRLLFGMAVVVLLVTCGNVSNLLLVRGASRERELAIRAALGAGRSRIARQLLTESLLLALVGGVLGTALAAGGVQVISRLGPASLREHAIALDLRVLAFAFLLCIGTALAFGLVPALRGARADLQAALREGSRGNSSRRGAALRAALAVLQVSSALALLVAGALLVKSFARVQANEPGVDARGVLAFSFVLPESRYPAGSEPRTVAEIVARLRSLPGVRSAAATSLIPFSGDWDRVGVEVEGAAAAPGGRLAEADRFVVTPEYFRTLGIRLLGGRTFGEEDRAGAPGVAVVDRGFVDQVLDGHPALGRRVRRPGDGDWTTIVGVVDHVRHYGLDAVSGGQIYFAQAQHPWRWQGVLVRTDGEPLHLLPAARRSVWSVDPQLAVYGAGTLDAHLAEQGAVRRLTTTLVAIFAAVAAVVAVIGLYGVIAYGLAQRRLEFGIRLALGATPAEVVRSAGRRGALLVLAGLALGLALALAGGGLLSSVLYGVSPRDPALLAGAALLLGTVSCLASYIPARRATRVDPILCLRAE